MAVDGYAFFKNYEGKYMRSDSQVDLSKASNEPLFKYLKDAHSGNLTGASDGGASGDNNTNADSGGCGLFEIDDFSFGIEQTLNIGSQSPGAGAGKCTFNPFSITRKTDRNSPRMFEMACSGTPFQEVGILLRKGGGGPMSGAVFLMFRFKLAAVKNIDWSNQDESPQETIQFEYGALQIHYSPQNPDGKMTAKIAGGWNRVKNKQDTDDNPIK
jgi:type VI secretion system secreted protein Hcp